MFDVEWYVQQVGHALSDEAALEDYVRRGRRAGLSPAPFFEPSVFDSSWKKRLEDPFALFLRNGALRRKARWHGAVVLADGAIETGTEGSYRRPPEDWPSRVDVDGRITSGEIRWSTARQCLLELAAEWRRGEDDRTAASRSGGRPSQERSFLEAMEAHRAPPARPEGPVVSVIMPTWNRQASVGRSIRSLQAQTFQDWELLVVDDGSTDDTLSVLEGYAHFDGRIKVTAAQRMGVGAARNRGISEARGEFVAFLDSDNTWEPRFLELSLKGAIATGARASFSSIALVGSGGTSYRVGGGRRQQLLVGNHVDLNALLVDRSLLLSVGGFAEDLRRTGDYDLVLRLSEHGDLTFLPFVGVVYDDDDRAGLSDRISVREPLTWDFVTRYRHLVRWSDAALDDLGLHVAMTTGGPRWTTAMSVASVLQQAPQDTDVRLVIRGGSRADAMALGLLGLVDERLEVSRTVVDVGVPLALDLAACRSGRPTTLLMTPGAVFDEGALGRLLEALKPGVVAAQPVLRDGRDLVVAAGTAVTGGGQLFPLLIGHATSDLPTVETEVPAVYGGPLLVPTDRLRAGGGLDPLFAGRLASTDLSLRLAREEGASRSVVVGSSGAQEFGESWEPALARTDAGVLRGRHDLRGPQTDVLRQRDLVVSSLDTHLHRDGVADVRPVLHRPTRSVQTGPAAGMPSLRWSIITAAPAGPSGTTWGDKHFGEALARSLRRLGQDAHVYAREARERRNGYLDDVRLTLRGLDPLVVDPARLNLLWVISHPEAVTDVELRSADAVFSAGRPWAAQASRRRGSPVSFLPQCTDRSVFAPPRAGEPTGQPPRLFIGNSRGVARPSVAHLLGAGVPIDVVGGGWSGLVERQHIKGTYITNDRLTSAYWNAGLVFNDHWADMREHGFFSNRLFDVAASGGCVITDYLEGLEELLPGSVRSWRTPDELLELASQDPTDLFGTAEDRRGRAESVATEHSFDARATVLLEAAARLVDAKMQQG
ncbi:glycosyltransferase [uncultured Pseudokineococcus sp.]|uniref:glycosyltransferase n=1 Tax=uncultured Pseudokineococcus sp. TaxID=1642928 RepID=UPI0026337D92|nr:glycosyltransferase [uncultured Pseudokineococcus sp.]